MDDVLSSSCPRALAVLERFGGAQRPAVAEPAPDEVVQGVVEQKNELGGHKVPVRDAEHVSVGIDVVQQHDVVDQAHAQRQAAVAGGHRHGHCATAGCHYPRDAVHEQQNLSGCISPGDKFLPFLAQVIILGHGSRPQAP